MYSAALPVNSNLQRCSLCRCHHSVVHHSQWIHQNCSCQRLSFQAPESSITHNAITQHTHNAITHNGYIYKSLANHNPYSQELTNEHNKLYPLTSGWELCPNTPDALHVCASYHWATYALVFADGSAHWTLAGPRVHSNYQPGAQVAPRGFLRQKGGRYGPCYRSRCLSYYDDKRFNPCCDVLVRRMV